MTGELEKLSSLHSTPIGEWGLESGLSSGETRLEKKRHWRR
jgi:hypothetical protein